MRKPLTITVTLVAFLLLSLVASVHAAIRFEASLNGLNEEPPVITLATGDIALELNDAGTELAFELSVNDLLIGDITAAHIHVAPEGENGPIIFFLARSAADFQEGVVRGVLTERDLIAQPDRGITTFGLAVNAMLAGNTYANVHTQQNPDGEIRGQIAQVKE